MDSQLDTAQRRAEALYEKLYVKDDEQEERPITLILQALQQARLDALAEARKVCDEHKISLSGNEPNYCRHHNCSREIADALDRLREGRE